MILPPAGAEVLVVDDDPGVLRAVSRILGKRHRVACVATGTAALEAATRLRPEVAVVDIGLPDLNGFEVTRELKAAQPDLDVILMTGNSEEPDENLIRAIDEGAFYFIEKPFDRRVLLTLVARCLELRRLREERERYLKRVERELEEARQFQVSLLPPPHFSRPGLAIDARYLACNELAGDFHDYVASGPESIAFLVADVVGHGASAAMMTGVVKSAFRAAHADDFRPMSVLDRVREGLRDFDPSRFVTLFCGTLDTRRHELTYVNAGHPSSIIRRRSSEPVPLEPTGPLISSALYDLPCEQASAGLEPGDLLLAYTDGITEAHGPGGMFGHDRLVSAVTREGRRGAALLDGLIAEVTEFSGSPAIQDDITLLSVELRP
jgi:sigma-B regulation protein RsbU (phosphoserine phosphatase)